MPGENPSRDSNAKFYPLGHDEVLCLTVDLQDPFNDILSDRWAAESLAASEGIGGWYRDAPSETGPGTLYIKLPSGGDPNGLVHLAGNYDLAIEFIGSDIWVEGLNVEYYDGVPGPSTHYDQSTTSGFKFTGDNITVRNNTFRYLRTNAINISGVLADPDPDEGPPLPSNPVENVLIEHNRFLDGQTYMSYRQTRNGGGGTPGRDVPGSDGPLGIDGILLVGERRVMGEDENPLEDEEAKEVFVDDTRQSPSNLVEGGCFDAQDNPVDEPSTDGIVGNDGIGGTSHKPSGHILLNVVNNATVRYNYHDYNLYGLLIAGGTSIDVYRNFYRRVRNVPVIIKDTDNAGHDERIGNGITGWDNIFQDVGWSIPSNEATAQTGPVYWINNIVQNFGSPGSIRLSGWPEAGIPNQSILASHANRYGGSCPKHLPSCLLGIQRVYDNLIASCEEHPEFGSYHGWNTPGKDFHHGSAFFNNVWILPNVLPGSRNVIWGAHSGGPGGVVSIATAARWDYNQYFMDPGDNERFVKGAFWTLEFVRTNVEDQTNGQHTFEPHGAYSDPGWTCGLTISNPLPEKMTIDGVTDNLILFPP